MGSHEPIRGIDRVYCGHTPQFEGAVRLGQVMFLDTGGAFSQMEKTRANHPMASLTMAGMCFSTGLLTAAPLVYWYCLRLRILSNNFFKNLN